MSIIFGGFRLFVVSIEIVFGRGVNSWFGVIWQVSQWCVRCFVFQFRIGLGFYYRIFGREFKNSRVIWCWRGFFFSILVFCEVRELEEGKVGRVVSRWDLGVLYVEFEKMYLFWFWLMLVFIFKMVRWFLVILGCFR